jgi:peptidoglycan/xylan/chitin deacetylase (PgdA/CDA1 family)
MLTLLLTVLLFITPFYIIYKPPSLLFSYFEYRWPSVLFRVRTSDKVIALTIDDAPSEYTTQIAAVLAENDAHATFFVIGNQVNGREPVLEELVKGGHELGNHAMRDEASRGLSVGDLTTQIATVETSIKAAYTAAAGSTDTEPPRYFRPGSGFFSTRMLATIKDLGYRLVLGNVYPHDPQIPYPSVNARHVLSMVRPGAIVICHDRRAWTVPMLKKVLPELKRKGYRILTVSGLLEHVGAERDWER